jgi:hypothetical protein
MLPLQHLHFGEHVTEVLRVPARTTATLHPFDVWHCHPRAIHHVG